MMKSDCVVVGAGLIGLMVARELSQAGMRVIVLERGEPGQESSWAGGGILTPLYPWRYAPAVNQLAAWSQDGYPEFCRQLLQETGIDPEWLKSGLLLLDQAEYPPARHWAEQRGQRCEAGSLPDDGAVLSAVNDGTKRIETLLFPDVAQVRNPRLLKALVVSLENSGVVIRSGIDVTGMRCHDAQVFGVDTNRGIFSADHVVVAGGAWSASLLQGLGATLAVEPVRGQMLLFRAKADWLRHIVLGDGHYAIPRKDGHILVGSTLEYVGFDCRTTLSAREQLLSFVRHRLPGLLDFELIRQWAGLRPGSVEGIPYISEHPVIRGLFINAGHFRNGVVMGPASARLLRDIIMHNPSGLIVDPAPYALTAQRDVEKTTPDKRVVSPHDA